MSRAVFRFAGRAVSVTGDDTFLAAVARLLAPYVEQTATEEDVTVIESVELDDTAGTAGGEALIAAFQRVRSVLLSAALRDHATLHGAVVGHDGAGIVLAGPKGAGKTSFASALLRCSPEWGFVTNDKSLVSPSDGSVLGLPFAVAVGNYGREMTPELADLPARTIAGKDLFWPADFARAFSSRVVPATQVRAVVLCEANFATTLIDVLTDVGEEERLTILKRDMTDFGDPMIPEWLRYRSARRADTPQLPAEWADLPWIRLRGNPWSLGRDICSAVLAATDSSEDKP